MDDRVRNHIRRAHSGNESAHQAATSPKKPPVHDLVGGVLLIQQRSNIFTGIANAVHVRIAKDNVTLRNTRRLLFWNISAAAVMIAFAQVSKPAPWMVRALQPFSLLSFEIGIDDCLVSLIIIGLYRIGNERERPYECSRDYDAKHDGNNRKPEFSRQLSQLARPELPWHCAGMHYFVEDSSPRSIYLISTKATAI
jgi:hypothetical protein